MTQFSLDDRYTREAGTIALSGIQALVRLPLAQHRADQRAGLNTATFIAGYRGSPLGGIDFQLQANQKLLDQHNIVFMPAVNEDLGATAVWGSQMAQLYPDPKYDGVLGIWYGKGPGVDRSGDAFKHANYTGVGRYGGVLAIAGDDPVSKSSTIPSHSEIALYDAQMPVLYPGSIAEVLELGRLGFELSRYSGAWVGFKIVTNIADAYGTVTLRPDPAIIRPAFEYNGKPWQHSQNNALLAPVSLVMEREHYEGRLEAARLFGAANRLNQTTVSSGDDWLGLVATGKTYYDLREALYYLGLDDAALQKAGIRLFKVGMIYPLDGDGVREFARGLEEIFVVEEKRGFLELLIRDVLYNETTRPRIIGKRDENGALLVPGYSELNPDQIADLLVKRLSQRLDGAALQNRLHALRQQPVDLSLSLAQPGLQRTPYFCSGCPHNRSTLVPEGSVVAAGIGCHGLVLLMDRNHAGITHMGGEGVQWAGAAPFSNTKHIFQNLGDGTLFHSGSMAIRQAVAAGTNITYKILFNGAVAMTGGQQADGEMPVPELTRALQAEGASKIIVCSHDPEKYPAGTAWAPGVQLWERDRLEEAQEILREVPGVTVLIYDQPCAADLRRKRKRGQAPMPEQQVFINEAVCEGCGDCGVKSNCLSVFPVETEYGRKTQIHQSSCNRDFTCLEGDCPAFVTVKAAPGHKPAAARQKLFQLDREIPEPRRTPPQSGNVFMTGIGGTGVVTTNQILATAALIDGRHANSLDQTGLSQKGGPVKSHLKISAGPSGVSNMIGKGQTDAYIVFDILSGTTDQNLAQCRPGHTIAVVSSSQIPTGAMVSHPDLAFPAGHRLRHRLEQYTTPDQNVYLDAIRLAEGLFGSHMMANMITVGAAYQAGALPLTGLAIEHAIRLNGVAVEMNLLAFQVGRLVVAEPDWDPLAEVERGGAQPLRPVLDEAARRLLDSTGADAELRRLLEIRVPELIAYQNEAYAASYVDFVKKVQAAENGDSRLSEAVARYLFKLMAYKDEYEVARLHLRGEFQQALTEQFGANAAIQYQLHPPLLKALGLKQKIGLGRWFNAGYWLLTKLKGVRGGAFDIFGYANIRRLERELIEEYKALIAAELATLTPASYDRAVQLAELPDLIRGYEEVKLRNVARYRAAVAELQTAETAPVRGE